ncbi:hypothetical protein CLOM_g2654 [Closterium sp. NIES-68]|nr:hypothetical protein CLOM_g2654 [Closterium sp. NIES-68]
MGHLDSRRADLRTTASSWNQAPNRRYSANFGSAKKNWKNYTSSWITFSQKALSDLAHHLTPPQYCSPSSRVTQFREPTNISTNFAAPSFSRILICKGVTIRFALPPTIVTRQHFEPDTAATKLEFLGHIIFTEGVKIYPKKIKNIREWKPPSTIKELRTFLGFVNYVRRLIPNMVGLSSSLTDQLKDHAYFWWGEKQQAASDQLKIAPPQQDFGDGSQPDAYESRKLQGAEKNYTIHDKEILAIVHAFKTWRCYLTDADITVQIDTNPSSTCEPNRTLTGDRSDGSISSSQTSTTPSPTCGVPTTLPMP